MSIEYSVRCEGQDLVCYLIIDRSDYVEIHRIPDAWKDDDEILCAMLIELCQEAAERDAGQLLPWVYSLDDNPSDMRVTWTTPLERSNPDRVPG